MPQPIEQKKKEQADKFAEIVLEELAQYTMINNLDSQYHDAIYEAVNIAAERGIEEIAQEARKEERERILKALENVPAEARTMGWDAYEGDFIRSLLTE